MLIRLLKIGAGLALATIVLVWPAAWLVDATTATEVIPVGEFFDDEAVIEGNLLAYDPLFAIDPNATPEVQKRQRNQELASVYGLDPRPATMLVLVDDERTRVVRDPETGESLTLYLWPGSHHPTQLQLVYWLARMTTIGAGIALIVFLVLGWLLGRRADGAVAAASA